MTKIEGYVDHIIYQNEDNGYTVLQIKTSEKLVTCIGFGRQIEEGVYMTCQGDYIQHETYGRQFKIQSFELTIPRDCVSIEKYLASGNIKGIGEKLARRIVEKFKEATFDIMEQDPLRLAEIKGISSAMAREFSHQLLEKQEMRQAQLFFEEFGVTPKLSQKIFEKYGTALYQILRENPYRLITDIDGIGFKIADRIAAKAGIAIDDQFRLQSGILYTLNLALQEGHCCLPQEELVNFAIRLLDTDEEKLSMALMNMALDENLRIIHEKDKIYIYLSSIYYLEQGVAKMLLERDFEDRETVVDFDKVIARLEAEEETTLESEQREGIKAGISSGISILTGGPGTGKTTTINLLIRYLLKEGKSVVLAAPTGRAAKRMSEATGYEAKTIHRLLEVVADNKGERQYFQRNEENPIEADVIILDEVSMVDLRIFSSLLKATQIGTRLILVGDQDQLPSVGAGNVLKDLIRSKLFKVTRLSRIFRQASESSIVDYAHKIHQGIHLPLQEKKRDFLFIPSHNQLKTLDYIQKILKKYQEKKRDCQLLTPMRKGGLGVEALNPILQEALNPASAQKKEKKYHQKIFRVSDKIMAIKNNYQIKWEIRGYRGIAIESGEGVFNGDIGYIRDIDDYRERVTIEFDDGKWVDYDYGQLDEIDLAYAITIHKSQGSEYDSILLPLFAGPQMLLNRNLLYTAVTRAKAHVFVVGKEEVVDQMIDNTKEQNRYSRLASQLKELEVMGRMIV